jgi:DNA-binding NarL/FixJ family response regulator
LTRIERSPILNDESELETHFPVVHLNEPHPTPEGKPNVSDTVPASPVRVFLLIENRLLREALDRLFRKRPDLNVVGRSGREETTPEQLREVECDVIAYDFFDPRWFPVSPECGAASSAPKSLLIGMSGDASQFVSAVQAGITGYLLKDASTTEVLSAVRATFRGEAVCPQRLCLVLFQHVVRMSKEGKPQGSAPRPDLTLRQQQLVGLVAKGLTNKEIAFHLNLSEYTVRNHIHRILKQVDAGSRSEAVEMVIAHGYPLNV